MNVVQRVYKLCVRLVALSLWVRHRAMHEYRISLAWTPPIFHLSHSSVEIMLPNSQTSS